MAPEANKDQIWPICINLPESALNFCHYDRKKETKNKQLIALKHIMCLNSSYFEIASIVNTQEVTKVQTSHF